MQKYDIKEYENACRELGKAFIKKYFQDVEIDDIYNMNPTGLYDFDGNFFTIDQMYEFIKYNYTAEQIIAYYEYIERGGKVCINAFKSIRQYADGLIKDIAFNQEQPKSKFNADNINKIADSYK